MHPYQYVCKISDSFYFCPFSAWPATVKLVSRVYYAIGLRIKRKIQKALEETRNNLSDCSLTNAIYL